MLKEPGVLLVEPWGEGQGDYVRINEADFDPAKHKLYEPAAKRGEQPSPGAPGLEAMTVKELQALAAEKGIDLGDATKKADIIAAVEAAKPGEQ